MVSEESIDGLIARDVAVARMVRLEKDIHFKVVGHLDAVWDVMECGVCFALVSEERTYEHAYWHEGGSNP